MKKWEINGLSLAFDMEDLETAERYEQAFTCMEEEEKQLTNANFKKMSEKIRAYCDLYENLFARLFDADTSAAIFANQRKNTRIYEETYLSFLRYVQNSVLNAADRRRENLAALGTKNDKSVI